MPKKIDGIKLLPSTLSTCCACTAKMTKNLKSYQTIVALEGYDKAQNSTFIAVLTQGITQNMFSTNYLDILQIIRLW